MNIANTYLSMALMSAMQITIHTSLHGLPFVFIYIFLNVLMTVQYLLSWRFPDCVLKSTFFVKLFLFFKIGGGRTENECSKVFIFENFLKTFCTKMKKAEYCGEIVEKFCDNLREKDDFLIVGSELRAKFEIQCKKVFWANRQPGRGFRVYVLMSERGP